MKKILAIILLVVAIIAIAGYAGAADSVTQQASVTVKPVIALSGNATIDFGTVADSTAGPTTLTVTNTLTDGSNMKIDVYTRANDTKMVNTDSSINDIITPIQFTPYGGSATDYTIGYQMAYDNWPKPHQGGSPVTWDEILTIIVPSYTNNGTYVVTIYNTAVAHNAVAPTTP